MSRTETPVPIRILPVLHAAAGRQGAANGDGGPTPGSFRPPQQMSASAAGFDLTAALPEPVTLSPGERRLIPCGFCMEMPAGYEAQVRPRSGLAVKFGITCLNSPGTIDADYRGEVQVLLINHGDAPFVVDPGMRIAQLVFARHAAVTLEVVSSLSASGRGQRGFGSTGTSTSA